MKRSDIVKLAPAVILSLILGGLLTAWAQGKPAPEAAPQVKAGEQQQQHPDASGMCITGTITGSQVRAWQQQQLGRLKGLETQLFTDREALHQAAAQSGCDSDQVDLAQEQLFKDREEYRKLRRTLRAEGVAVPPPYGAGAGATGGRPSSSSPSAGPHGMCANCPSMDDCTCCPR